MGLVSSILQCCGLAPMLLPGRRHIAVAILPDPDNCARCHADADGAVRHPWRSAVSVSPQARRLPWIALCGSLVIAPGSGHTHRLPDNSRAFGSTNDWLALGLGQTQTCTTSDSEEEEGRSQYHLVHNYVLHNPFSNKSLPLPELDAVVVDNRSLICKFLMRSTVDDFIAVITNNRKHPLIVFLRGKGVWSPEPTQTLYTYIIDMAFLGDKLYAITRAEDLIPLDLTLDEDGRPMVTMRIPVISQYLKHDYDDSSTTSDEEDDDDDHCQNEEEEDEKTEDNNDEDGDDEVEDNDMTYNNCSIQYDHEVEPHDITIVSRHLIESHGKLLMVRHRRRLHPDLQAYPTSTWITLQVDVFEADFSTHAWVPLAGGLGGGRALFVSMDFSKAVQAPCGEVKEDDIYFMDTGNVFNMKSGTSRPSKLCQYSGNWLFPPEYQL